MQYENDVIKKTLYDQLVKRFNAIQTFDTGDLFKNADYNKKIENIENKIRNHDIYNPELNKLTKENFPEKLKQAKLAAIYLLRNM